MEQHLEECRIYGAGEGAEVDSPEVGRQKQGEPRGVELSRRRHIVKDGLDAGGCCCEKRGGLIRLIVQGWRLRALRVELECTRNQACVYVHWAVTLGEKTKQPPHPLLLQGSWRMLSGLEHPAFSQLKKTSGFRVQAY